MFITTKTRVYLSVALLVGITLLSACAENIPKSQSKPASVAQFTTPTGTLWVADEANNSVTVIDASKSKVIATLTGIEGPHNIQATPDGKRIWTVSGHDSRIVVIDANSYSIAASIPTGKDPAHVILTPNGKTAYVTNSGDNSVTVIDTTAMSVIATIPVGKFPHGLRPSPDGKWIYVANAGGTTLSVIDTTQNTTVADIEVGKKPVQVGFSPNGKYVYFSLNEENAVGKVDVTTRKMIGKVEVGKGPVQVFVTPDNKYVLAANQGSQDHPSTTVSVIDIGEFTTTRTIDTGRGAHGIVIDPSGQAAYVTNIYDNNVAVIDINAGQVITNIATGTGPNGISFSILAPAQAPSLKIALEQNQTHSQTLTVTNNEGDVAVSATWKGIDNGEVTFEIAMNSHTVDLDNYDLAKLALLRNNQGHELVPLRWVAPQGGHHRTGTLTFPLDSASDQSQPEKTLANFELIIKDVGGINSRSFVWMP